MYCSATHGERESESCVSVREKETILRVAFVICTIQDPADSLRMANGPPLIVLWGPCVYFKFTPPRIVEGSCFFPALRSSSGNCLEMFLPRVSMCGTSHWVGENLQSAGESEISANEEFYVFLFEGFICFILREVIHCLQQLLLQLKEKDKRWWPCAYFWCRLNNESNF